MSGITDTWSAITDTCNSPPPALPVEYQPSYAREPFFAELQRRAEQERRVGNVFALAAPTMTQAPQASVLPPPAGAPPSPRMLSPIPLPPNPPGFLLPNMLGDGSEEDRAPQNHGLQQQQAEDPQAAAVPPAPPRRGQKRCPAVRTPEEREAYRKAYVARRNRETYEETKQIKAKAARLEVENAQSNEKVEFLEGRVHALQTERLLILGENAQLKGKIESLKREIQELQRERVSTTQQLMGIPGVLVEMSQTVMRAAMSLNPQGRP